MLGDGAFAQCWAEKTSWLAGVRIRNESPEPLDADALEGVQLAIDLLRQYTFDEMSKHGDSINCPAFEFCKCPIKQPS